ncbi:MAG: hypothetical protein R2706_13590 [Acidimicrobiales bacterium]
MKAGIRCPDQQWRDDLVAQWTQLGDIDPRSDRRQAVLETILSTTDQLIVTRTAFNERTNAAIPPPIAIAELIDVLRVMTAGAFTPVTHARQLFDEGHFDPQRPEITTFDRRALRSAEARRHRRQTDSWLAAPLPPVPVVSLSLHDLRSFLSAPTRTFFTKRLDVRLSSPDESRSEQLVTQLDPLEKWTLTDELLTSHPDRDDWAYFHQRVGDLPAGVTATASIEAMTEAVDALTEAVADVFRPGTPVAAIEVDLHHDDTRMVGVVDHLVLDHDHPGILFVTNSRLKATHILHRWLELVIATLHDAEPQWRAVVVAKNPSNSKREPIVVRELRMKGSTSIERHRAASEALTVLLDLYRRALCEPLPLFAQTSRAIYTGGSAKEKWLPYAGQGDVHDVYNAEVWGAESLDELVEHPTQSHDPVGPFDANPTVRSRALGHRPGVNRGRDRCLALHV